MRGELARRSDNAESEFVNAELASLVRSMLAPQPTERPGASAVADKLSELLDVRTCYVCMEPWARERGLECDGTTRHFACDGCFSFHVSRAESLHEGGDRIKCCGYLESCASTFTLQAAAQHATPIAFETHQRHADDRKHVAMEGEFELWKELTLTLTPTLTLTLTPTLTQASLSCGRSASKPSSPPSRSRSAVLSPRGGT